MKLLIQLYFFIANQTKQGRLRKSGNKESICSRVSTAAGIELARRFQKMTASQSNNGPKNSTGNLSALQSTELSISLEGKIGKDATKTSDAMIHDGDQKVQAEEPSMNADLRENDKEESGGGYERYLDESVPDIVKTKGIDDFMENVAWFIGSAKGSARVAVTGEREATSSITKNEETQPK